MAFSKYIKIFIVAVTTGALFFSPTFGSARHAKKKKEYLAICPNNQLSHGFFSTCDLVLATLYLYEQGYYGKEVTGMTVDFQQKGFYYTPRMGNNWWSYYFYPVKAGKKEKNSVRRYTSEPENKYAWGYRRKPGVTRKEAKQIISKYIKVKPHISKKIEDFVTKKFDNHFIIGVHYRGTDKVFSGGIADRVPYRKAAEAVKKQIGKVKKNYKIFIATDELAFLNYMRKQFPGKIIATNANRSTDGTAVHHLDRDPYILGEEALIDCLLLSKCNVLIRTSSNVSLWSTFFNPNIPVILLNFNKNKGAE